MFKKILSILILISVLFSTTVFAENINPYEKNIPNNTILELKNYVEKIKKMNIVTLTDVTGKIDKQIAVSTNINDKNKYLYLKYELNKKLEELTGLHVNKLDLFYKFLKTKDIGYLKELELALGEYKQKYSNNEKILNAIYYLNVQVNNILQEKLKKEGNKENCLEGEIEMHNYKGDKIICMQKGSPVCKISKEKGGKYYVVSNINGEYDKQATIDNCNKYSYAGVTLIKNTNNIDEKILTNKKNENNAEENNAEENNAEENNAEENNAEENNNKCSEDEIEAIDFEKGGDEIECIDKKSTICKVNNKTYFGNDINKLNKFCKEKKGDLSTNGKPGCDKNSIECEEDEKKVISMHTFNWGADGKPIYWCVSKDTLTCHMNGDDHIASSDHEIRLFCERHAEDGAYLTRGDEVICGEQQKKVYPISAYGNEGTGPESSEEDSGVSCVMEGDLSCTIDGVDYIGESDEETESFCEENGGELNGGIIKESYENYLCNSGEDGLGGTIYGNSLGSNYICKAPIGTNSYTVMTVENNTCIDVDKNKLKLEGEKNKFSKQEKQKQYSDLNKYKTNLEIEKNKRYENFSSLTSGMSTSKKNILRKRLDLKIKAIGNKLSKLKEKMMLFDSYKFDSLGAKSVAEGSSTEDESKQCTQAGFFGESDDDEDQDQEITIEIEKENVSNYLKYFIDNGVKDNCGGDFVMHRKLIGMKIDSMDIEASCKDKDEKDKEDDIVEEIKEFGGTDILDWVVYIKVNEQKDICEGYTWLERPNYCKKSGEDERIIMEEKRQKERKKKIEKWKEKIKECATGKDARTIKQCYIDNPHPDGQEVYAYKAIAAVKYGIFKGSLVESDDFDVIQPEIFLDGDGDLCNADGEKCDEDGNPLDEEDGDYSQQDTAGSEGEYSWTEGKNPFILDNDFFDPDWVIMLQAALSIDKKGYASLKGVNIIDRDTNKRSGMLYDSIMYYNNRGAIPLGVSKRRNVRTDNVDATQVPAKRLNKKVYKGKFRAITQFKSDGCLDGQSCSGRYDPVELICKVLSKSKEKVSYVTGGQLHNLADFLKEKKKCNGIELARKKLKQVVLANGWKSRTSGAAETNFSRGPGAAQATKDVIRLMPKEVPIIIATVPANISKSEYKSLTHNTGDYFINHKVDSPMSFILGVDRYGIYGDHGNSDTESLFYAVFGNKFNGKTLTKKVKTCMIIHNNGAMTVSSSGNCNHYYLDYTTNVKDFVKNQTQQLLKLFR